MSQKKIEFKSRKAQSHDEKKIQSSQHSKIKKNMADQLRGELDKLTNKLRVTRAEASASAQEHRKYQAYGKGYEESAEQHWRVYKTWFSEVKRLGGEIQIKLKAIQKYESPSKKMEEPMMIVDKKDYMKYGPSDEEE